MKKINIPTSFGHPTVKVSINSKDYQLETGKDIEVEDFIAECVENAFSEKPAKPAKPYYEELRVIKEFDFANDADERGTINYEWFDFRAEEPYVIEANGTMIDIDPQPEYGSGYGEYSGKPFGENLHITCTNATCKAPLKVKLMQKVHRPVLEKPYITVFVHDEEEDNFDECAYIDPEMTIPATRAYVLEAIKAGKTIVAVIDGGREFVADIWDGIDYVVITGTREWLTRG